MERLQPAAGPQPPQQANNNSPRGPNRSPTSHQTVLDHQKQLKITSRQLTVCLICLVAATSCLSPYLSLHLNQRVGLQLLELDVVQLRSSLISVIICISFLLISILLLLKLSPNQSNFGRRPQRNLKSLLGLTAILSGISYLTLALLVPRIKQVTRVPVANFDCQANLITIENCHQQFSTSNHGEQSFLEALHYLLIKDLSKSQDERLIKKLNCLQYKDGPQSKDQSLRRNLVGTRFLLHDCGLVCKPQRQYLRQFGDDLNAEPPAEAFQDGSIENDLVSDQQQQVSLKVCFSGESSGSPNSYKQFCITNLASRAQRNIANAQTLTVGQLNEMLRKLIASDHQTQPNSPDLDNLHHSPTSSTHRKRADEPSEQQDTHYVNPIVQFESHFNNWPHLSQAPVPGTSFHQTADFPNPNETNGSGGGNQWCNFIPIPPFIVNNKPFNEIQCSLEHEYTMSTAGAQSLNTPKDQQIFLKRSGAQGSSDERAKKAAQERCSIQCRLNIFYQVDTRLSNKDQLELLKHYYLPLKPCLVVSKEGNKWATIKYYTLFRSIADASLTLSIVFLALLLLLESIDAKQAPLDCKKHRIVGLLSTLAITPLVVSSVFELTSLYWSPKGTQNTNYITSWFQDRISSGLLEILTKIGLINKPMITEATSPTPSPDYDDPDLLASKHVEPLVDSYTTPFFLYTILMFILAILSLSLPPVQLPGSLLRLSSVETLGLSTVSNWNKSRQNQKPSQTSLTKVPLDTKSTKNSDNPQGYLPELFLLLAALFLGYQFSLCHIGETQIMLETFGGPNVNRWSQTQTSSSLTPNHKNIFTAVWFALSVSSASNLTLLLLALVFSTELSAFFSQFSLFKLTPRQTAEDRQRSNANLIMYIAISLLIYSIRGYILSGLTQSFTFKWFIVLIMQAVTTFNLPAIWLALSTRLHEMIALRTSKAGQLILNFHLLGESILALVYFALGRLLALFVHTIHTSLYLHSDDVDWFINTFYRGDTGEQQPIELNTTSSHDQIPTTRGQPEVSRLFSPLPSERQTYLHAARIFFRYNSLICLFLGSVLLATFLHLRYHIWAENRRTFEVSRWSSLGVEQASSLERDSCIDERLSADLLRIHSATKRSRKMDPESQGTRNVSARKLPSARARILYRYNVNRQDQYSDSSIERNSSTSNVATVAPIATSTRAPTEYRIPIATDEELDDDEDEEVQSDLREPVKGQQQEEVLERKVVRVRKIVRLKDGQLSHESTRMPPKEFRKRSISFAPTATLIGGGHSNEEEEQEEQEEQESYKQEQWDSVEKLSSKTSRTTTISTKAPKCASPEPSIDSDDQE